MKTTWLVLAAAVAAQGAGTAVGADVANGGFESGTLAGWFYTGNTGSAAMPGLLARDPLNAGMQAPLSGEWGPAAGVYFAALWSTDSAGSSIARLSQSFDALAGQRLEFDFFFDFGDVAPNFDSASAVLRWDTGDVILMELNTSPSTRLGDDVNVDWTRVSFVLPVSAVYTLEFLVTDTDGTFESVLGVDNVAVIPAPGAGLALLVLLGLSGARRPRW